MKKFLKKILSVGMNVVRRVRGWFVRDETLIAELYTPARIAAFIQTLTSIDDFKLILGSTIERMSDVTELDLEMCINPRA